MPKATEQQLIEIRTAEELAEAGGNHRAAFFSALDTRGTDARTRQFKFMDKVIKHMAKVWDTELNWISE